MGWKWSDKRAVASSLYNVEIRIPQRTVINLFLGCVPVVLLLAYFFSLALRIREESTRDQAQSADLIIVMGAAEYRGRPSPVLRARLDHALQLWRGHLAPLVMTTGGRGGDPTFTEADVGRSYLMDRGVPATAIVAEADGSTTMQSITSASETMSRMQLHSCILVSDGYHIFRAKRMLQHRGIQVYGSPRESAHMSSEHAWTLYLRQAFAFALWKAGITI